MEESEVINLFEEFISTRMKREATELARLYPEKRSLEIDFSEIEKFNPELADEILERPDDIIPLAEIGFEQTNLLTSEGKKFSPHVRFYNLPEAYDVHVQNLGASELNKLIKVQGVISVISEIKPRILKATWECLNCESKTSIIQDKNSLRPPSQCSACGKKGNGVFKLIESGSKFVNMQNAKLQELVERVRGSAPAAQIDVWLEDDLTNIVTPGEKVVVTGILRLRPVRSKKGVRESIYSKFLDAVNIQKIEKEFEEVEISKEEEKQILEISKKPNLAELIVQSVARGIYGYNEMKEAIALQLFGGTPNKRLPDGQKIRDDIHILLIGDPGTGKSQLLQYVERLAPKCIYVSGTGASGVGLTASAEKDEFGEGWVLKAGVLVLASGGVAALDELEKMREEDMGAIHSALEQQVVSVAKAGIVTKFKAKTAVLAAANPKFGRFDATQPVSAQFALDPALLSRFDLIFPIKDVIDETRDKRMAEHIIKGHTAAGEKTIMTKTREEEEITPPIPVDLFRKYIAYARRTVFPVLTPEANEKIKNYYLELRHLGEKEKTFPITARQIEGLIRLAEASAKMRLSPKVEIEDAERALRLMDYVLKEVFVDRETGKIDYDIVATGISAQKRDRIKAILGVITTLEKQMDLVSIEDVIKEAEKYGIEEFYARRLIEELSRQGDLYSPKAGFIKSARPKAW